MLSKNFFISSILLISLAFYPLFFRLDFSGSNYEIFDILLMVPVYSWVYLLFTCLLLFLSTRLQKRISFMHVIVASMLVYGLYSISQYPTIINGDVFAHGGSTLRVISNGGTQTLNYYPRWWPGAFILWANLTGITGLDVVNTGIILTIVMMVTWCALFYLLAKEILGQQWAGLATILYLVTDAYVFRWMGRDHFSPQSLAFAQFLLFLYLLMSLRHKEKPHRRTLSALALVVVLCIVVTHGFTSLYMIFTIFGIMVFERQKKNRLDGLKIFLFATISWLVWWQYNAGYTFQQAMLFLQHFLGSPGESKLAMTTVSVVTEPLPFIGMVLRNYYFKPLLVIVGLLSLIVVFRDRKVKIVSLFTGNLIGVILATILTFTSPMKTAAGQLSEVLMFVLLPVCYLASRIFVKRPRYPKIFSFIIILLIVPSFLNMFTYSSEYANSTHQWEVASHQFLVEHIPTEAIIATDWLTHLGYRFFDIGYTPGKGAIYDIDRINYTQWLNEHPTFFEGTLILRSFKQELIYNVFMPTFEERHNFWSEVDLNLVHNQSYSKIYDNGKAQIYVET